MPRPQTLYTAAESALNSLPSLRKHRGIHRTVKDIVICICESAQADEEFIDRSTLLERVSLKREERIANGLEAKSSKSTLSATQLSTVTSFLEKSGVLTSVPMRARLGSGKDKASVKLKTIVDMSPLLEAEDPSQTKPPAQPRRRQSKAIVRQQLDWLENQEGVQSLGPTVDPRGRSEAIFNGILDIAQRLSCSDSRKVIEVEAPYGQEQLKITAEARASSDSELMMLTDARLLIALNAMYTKFVEENFAPIAVISDWPQEKRARIPRRFAVDIDDLCEELDMKKARNHVQKLVSRVKDSVFRVDATSAPNFRERFMSASISANVAEYRYITHWEARTEWEEVEGTNLVELSPRVYLLELHELITDNLLRGSTSFFIHPELRYEKSGIAHRLYSWVRATLGVSYKAVATKSYLLDELHQLLLPASRRDNFCRDFISLLERECVSEGGWDKNRKCLSKIHGYYVEYDPDEEKALSLKRLKNWHPRVSSRRTYPVINIWRDREDYYIGDDSAHNKALRAKLENAPQQVAG